MRVRVEVRGCGLDDEIMDSITPGENGSPPLVIFFQVVSVKTPTTAANRGQGKCIFNAKTVTRENDKDSHKMINKVEETGSQ